MNFYNQELVYVARNAQGDITDVFEANPSRYYKVVDTAITADSSESSNVDIEAAIKGYAKRKGVG